MKRMHCYCDVCGKDMTYVDSDGETCLQGLFMKEPMRVDIETKTHCGSNSKQVGVGLSDFCSSACFNATITQLLDRAQTASGNMQSLS